MLISLLKRGWSLGACVLAIAFAGMGSSLLTAQAPPAGAPPPQGVGGAETPPGGGRGDAAAAGRGRAGGPAEPDFSPKPPVRALTPAEEAKLFWLPPGFTLEPVLSDPNIEEPAQIAFDGNGRMFVLELRSYMQDADGGGTLAPVGRISIHEDRNNDGIYETHGVFVDHLVFPRFVMPLGANAILTKESNADELWKFTDTNGDGVADKKELFTIGFGRFANVEHQEGGLMWALDNWMYSTINQFRIRWTPSGVLREPTGANNGQWSVTQDNYGKLWYQNGASGMPGYFQLPIAYGNFTYADQFEPDLNITWGAPVLIADMQGGMGSVRMPDGSLTRGTGSAGNDVYRGDRLPKDMIGDYFYGEVVARIIRRLRPVKADGLTQLRNVYPFSEFIRSRDPLFRPVDLTTAPDGTMYITDMYRGIIQESEWSGPGTYLRNRINQYQLDKVVRHGRIWRLSYAGTPRNPVQPRMLDESPARLVQHLSDPNGWWRDTAQQLLVLKQDKSVAPALRQLAQISKNPLARIHAMWTLEGLAAADAGFVRPLMKDADPEVRLQAIRVSETAYKAGDRSLGSDYKVMARDANPDVAMQALMTLNTLNVPDSAAVAQTTLDANKAQGVQLVANTILHPPANAGRGFLENLGRTELTASERATLEKGRTIYTELCFTCHGDTGRGEPLPGTSTTKAPALAGSPRVVGHRDYVIKVLLHGLTGPIEGERFTEVMIPMGQNPDEWVAAVGSFVRTAFGNAASLVTPADVARVRAASVARRTSWTVEDIAASLPRQLVSDASWKVTASHNTEIANYALTFQPWSSGAPQQAGMWVQVELPRSVSVTEIQFESNSAPPPSTPGAPPRTSAIMAGRGAAAGGPPAVGYPRGYRVQISMDGTTWSAPVAEGDGTGATTVIAFAPVQARFVRITQTSSAAALPPWNVVRLRLFEAAR